MTTKKATSETQKLQTLKNQLKIIKDELTKYKELFEADGTITLEEKTQLKKLQQLIINAKEEINNQELKIANLNQGNEPLIFNANNQNDSTFNIQDLETIKQQIQNDNNGTPFVDGDLEIRITVNFVLKEIQVLDEKGEVIQYSTTNYLEILSKTECVPAGKKYTIKIIGQSKNDVVTKVVDKKEKGDLVVYALPNYSDVFKKYKELIDGKKYLEAVKFIIKTYGFDKNQCPTYTLKITDDPWTGLTTEGGICEEQLINVRTGFLKVGISNEANFSQIVSAIGHEFVHIRQKGDLGMTEHIEREFLAYYWEVFQQGLPVMPFRRKFAAEQAINKYAKQFSDLQKEKYKSHIKRITDEYESKYKN